MDKAAKKCKYYYNTPQYIGTKEKAKVNRCFREYPLIRTCKGKCKTMVKVINKAVIEDFDKDRRR